MSKTFLIGDTHFGHEKTCTTFKRPDGSPLRPFVNAEEMNVEMIKRWNATVKPEDKVYHLGDVVINKKFLYLVRELNGRKVLIRGNHDILKTKEYIDVGFEEIYGVWELNSFILSHVPVHPQNLEYRWKYNIHGHLHGHVMEDNRYINVSVEQIDYTPIDFEVIRKRVEAR
jgi:calcineurin-like phosphoesterase family protein